MDFASDTEAWPAALPEEGAGERWLASAGDFATNASGRVGSARRC